MSAAQAKADAMFKLAAFTTNRKWINCHRQCINQTQRPQIHRSICRTRVKRSRHFFNRPLLTDSSLAKQIFCKTIFTKNDRLHQLRNQDYYYIILRCLVPEKAENNNTVNNKFFFSEEKIDRENIWLCRQTFVTLWNKSRDRLNKFPGQLNRNVKGKASLQLDVGYFREPWRLCGLEWGYPRVQWNFLDCHSCVWLFISLPSRLKQ